MIMGHIGFGDKFAYWKHTFHMSIFFFISGFRLKKKNIKDTLMRKVMTLLIPYFCVGLGCYTIWCVGHLKRFTLEPLKHLLWFITDGIVICRAIWFLTALSWDDIIYAVLDKYISNIIVLSFIIEMIALISCILRSVFIIRFPWTLDVAFVGLGFYHTARLLSKKRNRLF